MGDRFLTDKKIEDYLEEEVRGLPMTDGRIEHVRSFKLTWANYDLILQHGTLSAAEIGVLVAFYANKTAQDLGTALRDVLGPLRKAADQRLTLKIALRKRRLTMRTNLLSQFAGAAQGKVKPRNGRGPDENSKPIIFRSMLGPSARETK